MPPNLSAHHPPWPWAGGDSPPLKRPSSGHKPTSPKRVKIEGEAKPTEKRKKEVIGKVQQGKITEYFKSQMKKKDGKGETKFFTLIDGPKVIVSGKCEKIPPDLYKKFDVRTLTVTTPVKKVVLDTKTKKISQLISVPRKILPGPKPKQLTTLRIQNDLKCLPKPLDNLFIKTAKLTRQSTVPVLQKVSPVPILQKVSQVTNLNLKISSTVVPIIKLNNLPSKLNGSINNNTFCVETAVPTIPAAKPKQTIECLSKSTHQSPSLKTEESKSDNSDSGVSVKELLSVCVTQNLEAEGQKSPILSQPKTIRFPAKQITTDSKDQRRTDSSESGHCRWSECQAQFDTSGALLEHLQVKISILKNTAFLVSRLRNITVGIR